MNDINDLTLPRAALAQQEKHSLRRYASQLSLPEHAFEVVDHEREKVQLLRTERDGLILIGRHFLQPLSDHGARRRRLIQIMPVWSFRLWAISAPSHLT